MSPLSLLVFFLGSVLCLPQMSSTYEQHKIVEYNSPAERQGLLIRHLRSYEIDYPTITDHKQSHLGYLTAGASRRRRKRAINLVDEHDPFHYQFRASGKNFTMKLWMNRELFGPDFQVENFYENGTVEKKKMEEHCYLVGQTIPHNQSVAISDCDGLFGVVTTSDDLLFIEPLLNNSFVEKEKLNGPGRPHLIYKQSQLAKIDRRLSPLDTYTRIEPARRRSRPVTRNKVHLSFVKFINLSGRIVKLMYKDPARGERKFFSIIMPGASKKVNTFTVHRWFAVDEKSGKDLLIGGKNVFVPRKNRQSSRDNVHIRLPRGVKLRPTSDEDIKKKIGEKYIEAMTVADKSVVTFHGKDKVATYIMALMNVVSFIFRHKSLGVDLHYVLVRIVLLHETPKEIAFKSSSPNGNLIRVCNYMAKIREGKSDADPKFHDSATFLTRRSFGPAAGYAPVYTMCHPSRSCTLNDEDGFSASFIIAHEIGHTLGMEHDHKNGCGSEASRGSIMAPLVQAKLSAYHWSSCSRKELMGGMKYFRCLNDKPNNEHKKDLPYLHKYPGFHFSKDEQCRFDFGKGYTFCKAFYKDPCQALWCNMPRPYRSLCKSLRGPALDGTECGKDRWCRSGSCVKRPAGVKLPDPVDGKWNLWSDWGSCSKKCGVGLRTRTRKCNNPAPSHGGKACVGKNTDQDVCNTQSCTKTVPLHENEIKGHCQKIGQKKDPYKKWSYYDESKVNLDCTFEDGGLCSWVNMNRDDQRDWTLHSGKTPTGETGPSIDHTTLTQKGKYIYYETSDPVVNGDRARLSSPELAVRSGCLSFWYHMYSTSRRFGTLRVLTQTTYRTKVLWSNSENRGNHWIQAHVDINEYNLYKLIFEAERYSYRSDIALDDITFRVGPCSKESQANEQAVVDPCVVTCKIHGRSGYKIAVDNPVLNGVRCYNNNSLDICYDGQCRNVGCDGVLDSAKEFDNCGICGGDNSMCRKVAAKSTKTSKKYVESIMDLPKGASNLYFKKNKDLDHLLVLSVKTSNNRVKHLINGNVQKSPPAIYSADGTQFVYTSENGEEVIKSLGAINQRVSIKMKKGRNRQEKTPVSFEYEYFEPDDGIRKAEWGNKGYEAPDEYHWEITNKWTPCSRSCNKGASYLKYFCKLGSKKVPRLHCKHLKLNVKKTFRFCNTHPCGESYQWSTGLWSECSKTCSQGDMTRPVTCIKIPGNKPVLRVHCTQEEPKKTKTCIVKPCAPKWSSGRWNECSVSCDVGVETRNVFCADDKGKRTSGCDQGSKPASRRTCKRLACPSAGALDCNFEKDLCQWKQMKDDNFDWARGSGKTPSSSTGPSQDHTLKTREGHYLFIEASGLKNAHQARLISPEINSRHACLTFYYHMWGTGTGTLSVKLRTKGGYMEEFTWTRNGDQGNRWIEAKVNISIGLSYQIVFEATRGNGWKGDIAIDDIRVRKAACKHEKIQNKAAIRNDVPGRLR